MGCALALGAHAPAYVAWGLGPAAASVALIVMLLAFAQAGFAAWGAALLARRVTAWVLIVSASMYLLGAAGLETYFAVSQARKPDDGYHWLGNSVLPLAGFVGGAGWRWWRSWPSLTA